LDHHDLSRQVPLFEGEKIEGMLRDKIWIIQKPDGYRFSVDPVLLAHFVDAKSDEPLIDLGTGAAVIPMILRKRLNMTDLTGVELQHELADRAVRSVKYNGMDENIRIVEGDVRKTRTMFEPESFQAVVSNPPFFPFKSGRTNPNMEKAIARHEVTLTLEELVDAMAYLLKSRGKAYIIYPVSRLTELNLAFRSKNLEPKKIRFVHTTENAPAKLLMMQAVKGGKPDLEVDKPLYVFNMEGIYSGEMQDILG